jgi:hypothetical protein
VQAPTLTGSLLLASGVELLEIDPQVTGFLLILDAGRIIPMPGISPWGP